MLSLAFWIFLSPPAQAAIGGALLLPSVSDEMAAYLPDSAYYQRRHRQSADLPPLERLSPPVPPPAPASAPLAPLPPVTILAVPEPVAVAPAAPMPAQLSPESQRIIARIPKVEDKSDYVSHAKAPIHLNRATPNALLSAKEDVKEHKGVGMRIEVRRPSVDMNMHLEKAYQAAMNGDSQGAAILYAEVLQVAPDNTQALFGLASVDQKMGKNAEARPLYGRLLEIDPHHRGALNNFLVLAGEEAPQDALAKLGALEGRNPDFSPIPAQIAIIDEKLGRHDDAVRAMQRAIAMSPENTTYRYDLAVILDHGKNWKGAADIYLQLLAAADRGEPLPAKRQEIQERLTFIRNNTPG